MTAPISPATAEQAEREACESPLTVADRQALGNIVRGLQQVIASSAATRVSERAILLALVKQAEAILQRDENRDGGRW